MFFKNVLFSQTFLGLFLGFAFFTNSTDTLQNDVLPAQDQDKVFMVVEEMPRFPGCEDEIDKRQRKICADDKLMDFVFKNVAYPDSAKNEGISGTVVVSFVVDTSGALSNKQIIKSVHPMLDQAVLDVVDRMPKWIPGKQQGKKVRVRFNLPVRFKMH